jgi:hypothetical protein
MIELDELTKDINETISAAALRDIGFPIPGNIPDCAEVDWSDVNIKYTNIHFDKEENCVKGNVELTPATFKWVVVDFKIPREVDNV